MIRALTALALVPATLLLAPSAHATDQSYLDYLKAHGFNYQNKPGMSTPDGVVKFGRIICDNLRHGLPAREHFDKTIANSINQVMVDGARQELCPDVPSATTTTTVPTTTAVPTPTPESPTPEPTPPTEPPPPEPPTPTPEPVPTPTPEPPTPEPAAPEPPTPEPAAPEPPAPENPAPNQAPDVPAPETPGVPPPN